MQGTLIIRNFVVSSASGLHLRCAALLAKAAMHFEAAVTVEYRGIVADAKSIMHLLTLGAERGAAVTISAYGRDAIAALQAIEVLFTSAFHERSHPAVPGGTRTLVTA